jgi:hypothetical protein
MLANALSKYCVLDRDAPSDLRFVDFFFWQPPHPLQTRTTRTQTHALLRLVATAHGVCLLLCTAGTLRVPLAVLLCLLCTVAGTLRVPSALLVCLVL